MHPAETGLLIPSDKGEVGGSSPPRPTIQVTSKYAAILTFPLLGNIRQKPICQLFANYLPTLGLAGWNDSQAVKPFGWGPNGWHRLGYVEKAPASRLRTWKAVQDDARTGKDWEGISSQFARAKFS